MSDLKLLDRAFHLIMQRFIKTGQAPHYTEVAKEMGLAMEDGRQLFHDIMTASCPVHGGTFPGWLHPGTDYIVSFPPFHNLPNQYRLTIDGEQKWFAQ